MKLTFRICIAVSLCRIAALSAAEPLAIDLTAGPAPAKEAPLLGGTATDGKGSGIRADSGSFFLDGKPWIPVVGEFHYSRYPRAEWREELLKMKAGGINTVSTYVFWIHHEEERGKYDWSGDRSLHDFLKTVQEVGLKAIVRIGPWAHGEVRNGGFPDWVRDSGAKLRTTDPAFLALVKPFFAQISAQMKGLLWKEGGPVIGVQLDNECNGPKYLLALKEMAREEGIDVPFYTMTGWNNVVIPEAGLLPVFGGYVDGFWGGKPENYRKEFFFTKIRTLNDLGAQFANKNPARADLLENFPYACAEIGPGMISSYKKRIVIDPEDVGAITVSKLGSGNNMPGYYMYQGGVNPDGKLSTLQEDHPNALPVKDYDFRTALGACGEVRGQYRVLREQHLLIQDFGDRLARMPFFAPEKTPAGTEDSGTLRWSVRSDGNSGFLFFNNRQPEVPLPDHQEIQFSVRTVKGTEVIPSKPITVPSGSYGIWPFGMDCDGVRLEYATVQPICSVESKEGRTFFFTALAGIRPELKPEGRSVHKVLPGTEVALSVKNPSGRSVRFVVLTPEQGRQFSRAVINGKERAILSKATVHDDGGKLVVTAEDPRDMKVAVFPPVENAGVAIEGTNGIFSEYVLGKNLPDGAPRALDISQIKPAGTVPVEFHGTEESGWNEAAVYRITLPPWAPGKSYRLEIDYTGDAARVYAGDRLIIDNFYNGEPFSIPLWRLPKEEWGRLTLRVMPATEGLLGKLPEVAKRKIRDAQASGSPDKPVVTCVEVIRAELPAPQG